MSAPLFSVIVPTRDRFKTVTKTLESILSQDHSDFEIIVSDNSSRERGRLQHWIDHRIGQETRVRYFDVGGGLEMDVNWERASLRASGEYVLVVPDRWVMRAGALSLLASIVERERPECAFWNTKLAADERGILNRPVTTRGPLNYTRKRSEDILDDLLQFTGYRDSTVYTQPFPRGLNSLYRRDVAERIRGKQAALFMPHSCDYTSGVGLLSQTAEMIHVDESLYAAIGSESNGQSLAVFGVSAAYRQALGWRGLDVDCVLATVLFDIEATLKRYERDALLQDMNVSNVLLSFLNEIHLKERHGSPLDTETMKARLMKYAQENQGALRDGLSAELRRYDEANTPRWKRLRRALQRAGLFYLAADMIRRVSNRIKTRDNLKYSDDCFSGRPLMKMEQRLSATIQSNND